MSRTNQTVGKHLAALAVAWIGLFTGAIAGADLQVDCTLDGYVAMGGMVCNTTNDYLLPGNQNSPPTGPPQNMETFGYAFLKFDPADLPGAAVDRAFLHLDVMALQDGMSWPAEGTASVGVFAVTADVAGINAGTAGAFLASIADTASDSVLMTGAGLISLDVTDIVNGWITSGDNYGLVLGSPGGLMPRLHSTETATGAAPVITDVPEPATLGLLGCGVVGFLFRRRKRRTA